MVQKNDDGGFGKSLAYGFEICAGAGLGTIVGLWIDRHFSSSPWGLLICLLLGCTAGFYLLLKDYNRLNKD